MKLLSISLLALTLGLGTVSYSLAEPYFNDNGTVVAKAVPSKEAPEDKPYKVILPKNLTPKQAELLSFAHDIAIQDGHKYPQYVQGIIMQESKAGSMNDWRVAGLSNRIGDRYFGIGQVKLVAAKAVMNVWPDMWRYLDTRTDEELQARLILDDHFNIRITSKYALMMGINRNPDKGIASYNRGEGGVKSVNPSTFHYTVSVKQKANELKNISWQGFSLELPDARLISASGNGTTH
jgi:hypothetical protein